MKLKVTETGVFDAKGKQIEVGSVIPVKGNKIPASLMNKCSVIDEAPTEAKAVTNPKRAGLLEQAKKAEVAVTDEMTDDAIAAAIKSKAV